ncbi:MAG: hypothetical protein QW728_00055 [Thermoplasmata archaeon]
MKPMTIVGLVLLGIGIVATVGGIFLAYSGFGEIQFSDMRTFPFSINNNSTQNISLGNIPSGDRDVWLGFLAPEPYNLSWSSYLEIFNSNGTSITSFNTIAPMSSHTSQSYGNYNYIKIGRMNSGGGQLYAEITFTSYTSRLYGDGRIGISEPVNEGSAAGMCFGGMALICIGPIMIIAGIGILIYSAVAGNKPATSATQSSPYAPAQNTGYAMQQNPQAAGNAMPPPRPPVYPSTSMSPNYPSSAASIPYGQQPYMQAGPQPYMANPFAPDYTRQPYTAPGAGAGPASAQAYNRPPVAGSEYPGQYGMGSTPSGIASGNENPANSTPYTRESSSSSEGSSLQEALKKKT